MTTAAIAAAGWIVAMLAPAARAGDVGQTPFEGRYRIEGRAVPITVTKLGDNAYGLRGLDWEGVGFFDGTSYWGVFQVRSLTRALDPGSAMGTHRATLRPDGSLAVHVEYSRSGIGSFDEVWSPEHADRIPRDTLPSFGEGMDVVPHVLQFALPEAVKKVPPAYPDAARDARVDGLVLLSVLVGEDGSVKDIRVRKSIPLLDEAAEACVRQWEFKPALSNGKPVAIWISVPIRFTLH
jgi:TonB family protein